jgi:predicted dinucleotide-binding enzyme
MRISILGAGNVGGTLGRAWARKGHDVFFGVPRPGDAGTPELLRTIGSKARAGTVAEAAAAGDVIVLATPGQPQRPPTKPPAISRARWWWTAPTPSRKISAAWPSDTRLLARSKWRNGRRGAKVFKAFNQTGFNIMGNPAFDGQRAVIFVCGDDETHKPTVLKLAADIGFEAIDAGAS